MPLDIVEKQAKYLADENVENDPDIIEVYWFPDENEVRLVEVNTTVPVFLSDEQIQPFYFPSSSTDLEIPVPSGIALIHLNEVRRLKPPEKWGGWDKAILIKAKK